MQRVRLHEPKFGPVSMGFLTNIIEPIMKCVSTVSFSLIINNRGTRWFKPSRGIRQGNLLSPYLFILCVEVLFAHISKSQDEAKIYGFKVSNKAHPISHLFFYR